MTQLAEMVEYVADHFQWVKPYKLALTFIGYTILNKLFKTLIFVYSGLQLKYYCNVLYSAWSNNLIAVVSFR